MSTPSRRQPALVTFVLALAVALTLAWVPAATAQPGDQHHARLVEQRISLEVLPPIRQPSTMPAPFSDARSVVEATLAPAQKGRQVVLLRRTQEGWRRVRAGVTDRDGSVTFFVPARSAGRPNTYRAETASWRGIAAGRSEAVVAGSWGAPDFVDEFDGDQLGAAWSNRIQFYNPWGGRACSKGSPDAVSVSAGVLHLSSRQDPAVTTACPATDANGNALGDFPYRLNGHISTQQSADFLYGVAAARMRFPRSLGQHAAFWLQPRGLLDDRTTPWGAEVDVVEWYGNQGHRNIMASAVHAPLPNGEKQQIGGLIPRPNRFLVNRSDSWWSRYHVFSVEWTPTEYIFRIAGHEVWRTSEGVSHVPEFLILSMLSSDFELPEVGTDPTPRTADVDWVAFWQAG
jgi:beta-glucanase (GH16 family)